MASKCGLTPQYTGLVRLQESFADRGFTVVGVPCNQFMGQEPGTAEEIQEFCSVTYGVDFPLLDKVDVNGDDRHPLYRALVGDGEDIKWNFEKFAINADGEVTARFAPRSSPSRPRSSRPSRRTSRTNGKFGSCGRAARRARAAVLVGREHPAASSGQLPRPESAASGEGHGRTARPRLCGADVDLSGRRRAGLSTTWPTRSSRVTRRPSSSSADGAFRPPIPARPVTEDLPFTGAPLEAVAVAASGLALTGVLLAVGSRRRRRAVVRRLT